MTCKVTIKNDSSEEIKNTTRDIIVGVLEGESEGFVEKYTLEPQNETTITIHSNRTIVIAEVTPMSKVPPVSVPLDNRVQATETTFSLTI